MPKSIITGLPSATIKILSGFKSLCTILLFHIVSSPSTNCLNNSKTFFSFPINSSLHSVNVLELIYCSIIMNSPKSLDLNS